ncbi:MAG: TonB-dependent receptor [Verrucomicrobiota bacterium]
MVFALSTASLAQTQNGATESVGELETEIVQGGTGFSAGNVISPAPIPKPQVTNVVVETPTRVDTEIKDQPSSIFVITQEDVARWAPLSFDDLTFQEPNVDFLGGPRYLGEQLIIRGEGGSAVNVRLDGGRQNFVSGHSGQRFFVETDFLKEVEILRGGGSFLYGSGSAGVVNISTLDPIDIVKDGNALGLRIRNTYHSNSNEWANSVVGAGIGEKVQFLAGWSDRSADNITQADDIELPFSAVDRSGAIGKFIWTPNDENTVTITLNSYETDDIGGANPQQLAAGNSQNALVDRTVQYMQWSGDWEWNPIDNDLINLKTTVYYNNTKQFRDYTITDPTDNNFGRENSVDYDVFGIDISNRSEVFIGNKRHQFVYGIDFYTESQKGDESRNTFFVPGTSGTDSRRPDAEADFLGIYLIDEVEVNDRLTLFGGIRYDTYESEKTVGSFQSQSDSSFSPQIGFDLEITEKLSFFGQYSRGFTAPFLNSLYQDGSHFGLVPLVNPNDVFAAIGRVRTPVVQATAEPPPPPRLPN